MAAVSRIAVIEPSISGSSRIAADQPRDVSTGTRRNAAAPGKHVRREMSRALSSVSCCRAKPATVRRAALLLLLRICPAGQTQSSATC